MNIKFSLDDITNTLHRDKATILEHPQKKKRLYDRLSHDLNSAMSTFGAVKSIKSNTSEQQDFIEQLSDTQEEYTFACGSMARYLSNDKAFNMVAEEGAKRYFTQLTEFAKSIPLVEQFAFRGTIDKSVFKLTPYVEVAINNAIYVGNKFFASQLDEYETNKDIDFFFKDIQQELELYDIHPHIQLEPMTSAYDITGHVVDTIIRNTIHHSFDNYEPAEGKHIYVSSEKIDEQNNLIEIVDNGKGIDEHILPRLLKEQVSRQAGETPTRGLGLLNAEKYLKEIGGYMLIENLPDTGVKFSLVFPSAKHENHYANLSLQNK